MPSLAQFLLSLAGSLAGRVLTALGIGIASYQGLSSVAASVIQNAQANYNLIHPAILSLLNLAGIGQCLGILAAALTTRASLTGIKKLAIK